MPLLGNAKTENDIRIYAVGDVHGRLDLLAGMHDRIAADLRRSPVDDHVILHLGDLVDRGPESAGVLDFVIDRCAADDRVMALMGNHEHQFLMFLKGSSDSIGLWMTYGGVETLASYGVAGGHPDMSADDAQRLREKSLTAIPDRHVAFMENLPLMVRSRDFLFVHAGIRPGVDLVDQDDLDLLYIRRPFLDAIGDLGVVVVHGHTPVDHPDIRPNRINVDTGAVYGNALTCVVLEGTEHKVMSLPAR